METEPRWLSWCSNGGDEVEDDEGGEGSSDVVVVKMEVAAIGAAWCRRQCGEGDGGGEMAVVAAVGVAWCRRRCGERDGGGEMAVVERQPWRWL
nr:hypothetical protein [Tanacetum cinerariifolium]